MVGLVFSKLSRPQLRQKTVIFSNHAVITLRNKKLCLIFRIGDLRDDNFILGTQVCKMFRFTREVIYVKIFEFVSRSGVMSYSIYSNHAVFARSLIAPFCCDILTSGS